MKEEKVSTVDIDAILANEELVKKLAAKVLDIVRQKPDSGVVCQGYYCDIAKEEPINELWAKKLNPLGVKLEEGLTESAAAEYPISADELDQVVTELKTSLADAKELSMKDLSRAVSKVLADNELMLRKGNMKVKKLDYFPCAEPYYTKYYTKDYCGGRHGLLCDYHKRPDYNSDDYHPNWGSIREELGSIREELKAVIKESVDNAIALNRTTYR